MAGQGSESFAMKAASWVPGGSLLTSIMSDEHAFRGPRRGLPRAVARTSLDSSNWFATQYFLNKDGLAIFWRRWMPASAADGDVKGVVVLVHGLGEHSGRYELLGTRLASMGFAVYALDHQGHGQSEGSRLFVKRFGDFCADVKQLAEMARGRHPKAPKCFLLGHSMGALVAIHTALLAPTLFDGAVLSAPPIEVDKPPGAEKIVPALAEWLPKAPAPPLDISTLCRDNSVLDRYMNDPLVNLGKPSLRLIGELLVAGGAAAAAAPSFAVPFLLMHGTADRICLHFGSESFHERAEVPDKTFVSFPGAYHELYNEPDREEKAIKETMAWLEARLEGKVAVR